VQAFETRDALAIGRRAGLEAPAKALVQGNQADAEGVATIESRFAELGWQEPLGQHRRSYAVGVQQLDDGEREGRDFRVAHHEGVGGQAEMYDVDAVAFPGELTLEQLDCVLDQARPAPIGLVLRAAVVPGHHGRVARVPAAVRTPLDVIDAPEAEPAPVEQALATDFLHLRHAASTPA